MGILFLNRDNRRRRQRCLNVYRSCKVHVNWKKRERMRSLLSGVKNMLPVVPAAETRRGWQWCHFYGRWRKGTALLDPARYNHKILQEPGRNEEDKENAWCRWGRLHYQNYRGTCKDEKPEGIGSLTHQETKRKSPWEEEFVRQFPALKSVKTRHLSTVSWAHQGRRTW